MGKKDKRIDAYIARSADFAIPILTHLRELVHLGCPDAEETIKWGFPHFEYHGIMCSMASFKQHCSFGFWKASLLDDPDKKLTKMGETAMGHLGRLVKLKDLPSDKVLLKYIKEAARLNEEGVQPERPKSPAKKVLKIPAFLKNELNRNKKAAKTFDGFSYSNKKDYVDWLTEAKTEDTRSKRLAVTLKWLTEGKSRNWKYEQKKNELSGT